MNRIVVTKLEHHQTEYLAYLVLDENRKLQELQVFEPEENTLLDHIYVGYVEKIVPNIHAAFVRIADGQKCYLPLNDVKNPVYTRKLSKKEALCEGDELLVQVVKDAVKTKDPVVSTKLVVHGHYCFLSTENTCLGVSKKLSQEESKRLSALLENTCKDHEVETPRQVRAGIQNQCRGGSGNRIMRRYRAGAERIPGFKEDRYTSECRRSGVPESPRLSGAVKSRKF